MTRDDMKRLLDSPVMRAWADGGTLQIKRDGAWDDVIQSVMTPIIKYLDHYRIKPEPKYRPWTPEEVVKQLRKCVTYKKTGAVCVIMYVGDDLVQLKARDASRISDYSEWSYSWLHDHFVTEDGKPCGTEVVDAG
jgi:hypothetical protein